MTLRLRSSPLPGLAVAVLAALTLAWAAPPASAAAAGAFTGPDDPALPALIAGLRGCLAYLAPADRRVLALRAGLGGHAPRRSAEVASVLGQSPAAAAAAEVSALRKLESQRRRGACQAQAATTPAKPPATLPAAPATPPTTRTLPRAAPAKPATTPPLGRAASSAAGAGGGSGVGVLDVALPALLALAFIAGISREMLRDPRA